MKRSCFILMAVAVSMASCVKNEDFAGNVPYEGFTVYAGMESTRVSVGESGSGAEGSGRKLSWEDGDAITVFDNAAQAVIYEDSLSSPDEAASFPTRPAGMKEPSTPASALRLRRAKAILQSVYDDLGRR